MNLPHERERVGMCACASQMAKRHEKKGGCSADGGVGARVLVVRFTSANSMRVRVTLQREAALVQRKAHTTQQLHQRVRFYLKLTHLAINLLNSAISYMKQKL